MNIFESKNYATLVYLTTLIVLLLIIFNFPSINQEKLINLKLMEKSIQKNKLTGLVTENKTANTTKEQNKEIYSEKSYFIYYLVLFFIGLCILIISLTFFMPLIKDYT